MWGDSLPRHLLSVAQPLEKVANSIVAGITLGPSRAPRENPAGYIRVANVQRGRINTSDVAQLEEYANDRPRYTLAARDIVMVEGHANPGQIGRCAPISQDQAGLLYQNHLFRLRFSEVLPEYALIWLNSAHMQAYWKRRCATSSGLYTINSAMLRQAPFPVLPELEQHRIVAAHATFERRIQALERTIGKLRTARVALVESSIDGSAALLGEVLAERPKNGYSPQEVAEWSGLQALGLGCLTEHGFIPRQLKNIPDTATARRYVLQDGDILMSRANTRELVGLVCRYRDVGAPCIYPDLMMRLRPNEERCLSSYLEVVLGVPSVRKQIRKFARGTSESMVKISWEAMRRLAVPLPRVEKQREIIQSVLSLDSRIDVHAAVATKLRTIQRSVVEDLLAAPAEQAV